MKYFVRDTSILDTRGAQSAPIPAGFARGSERDRSGTTVATDRRTRGAEEGAKVMERIARRERNNNSRTAKQLRLLL